MGEQISNQSPIFISSSSSPSGQVWMAGEEVQSHK